MRINKLQNNLLSLQSQQSMFGILLQRVGQGNRGFFAFLFVFFLQIFLSFIPFYLSSNFGVIN